MDGDSYFWRLATDLQSAYDSPTWTLLDEMTEDTAPHGLTYIRHQLIRTLDGDLYYRVEDCDRWDTTWEAHEVYSEAEVAEWLESDDGPFCMWDHEWDVAPFGLIVVHVDGADWYVKPEAH